jgi:hypothetical protein
MASKALIDLDDCSMDISPRYLLPVFLCYGVNHTTWDIETHIFMKHSFREISQTFYGCLSDISNDLDPFATSGQAGRADAAVIAVDIKRCWTPLLRGSLMEM